MYTPTKFLLGMALALTSGFVFAEDVEDQLEGGLQLLIAGGISSIDQDGTFNPTSDETDSLVQNEEDWNFWTAKVGIGYEFLIDLDDDSEDEDDFRWLPNVIPQVNLYYLDGDEIDGHVLRFEESNQADYTMDYSSARLMFDLAVTFASMQGFSIYGIGGLGISWNDTDFSTTPTSDLLPYGFELDSDATTSFAYEFGIGLGYDITDDIGISLEYLYASLGDVEVQGTAKLTGDGDSDPDDDPENSGYR